MENNQISINFTNSGIAELCNSDVQEKFESVITKLTKFLLPNTGVNWSYEQPAQQIFFVKPSLSRDLLNSLNLEELEVGLACSLYAIDQARTFFDINDVVSPDLDFAMYEIECGIQDMILDHENSHQISGLVYKLHAAKL